MIVKGTKIFGGIVEKITRNGIIVNVNGTMMEYSQPDVEAAFVTGNYKND